MRSYLLRRLGLGALTLILVSFLVYGLIRAMPGDAAALQAGGGDVEITPQQLTELRAAFGLDKHWTLAYFEWAGKVLTGNLGTSFHHRRSVVELILESLGPTLLLSVTSILLAYGISIPLGLFSAHRNGRADERVLTASLYALHSFPSYVMAILLILAFSVKVRWFPVFGLRSSNYDELSTSGKALDLLWHMALPVACYTYGAIAYYTRFIRSTIAEVLRQDYIRTARAKGLGEFTVLVKHAFRNSLIPFVTLIGFSFPALLSGSVILERIFAWPGMGQLFFESILYRDYPLIMALTMVFTLLVLAGNLIADLLYGLVDPRITYA